MKITLYVHPNSFYSYIVGDIAVFYATFVPKEGYSIPVIINTDKYIFEKADGLSGLPIMRIYKYEKQSTGPQ